MVKGSHPKRIFIGGIAGGIGSAVTNIDTPLIPGRNKYTRVIRVDRLARWPARHVCQHLQCVDLAHGFHEPQQSQVIFYYYLPDVKVVPLFFLHLLVNHIQ